jgi:hypothetical protein
MCEGLCESFVVLDSWATTGEKRGDRNQMSEKVTLKVFDEYLQKRKLLFFYQFLIILTFFFYFFIFFIFLFQLFGGCLPKKRVFFFLVANKPNCESNLCVCDKFDNFIC